MSAKEKTYYLVHLYFGCPSEGNKYTVYSYTKTRRFTAGQAWRHIRQGQLNVVASASLSMRATIESYWDILKSLNIPFKMADRYCTFGFIKS